MKKQAAIALFVTLTLAACGGSGSAPVADISDAIDLASTARSGPEDVTTSPSADVSFASILNSLRSDRGLAALTWDPRLDSAAQKYAVEQASISGLSHVGVDGSTVRDRIMAAGYDPRGWAENLAKGQQSEAAVLQAWINSPGHDRNLSAPLEDFALGVAGSGRNLSWVLLLATER